MYRDARNRVRISMEEASYKVGIGSRTLYNYEQGIGNPPPPEVVLKMSQVYDYPQLTAWYCRKECAIGRAYCYEILNNVDTSPAAILTKYRQEEREAHEALEHMAELMLNKRNRDDCTEAELRELWRWSLEMLDLEHVIETLKLRLWDFLDVAELVKDHNRKCLEKRYVDSRKPELQLAG